MGRWENSEVARSERLEGSKEASFKRWEDGMVRWEDTSFIPERGTQGESKTSSFCF